MYEWRPTIGDKCQKYGHSTEECRKNKAKEGTKNTKNDLVWAKEVITNAESNAIGANEDGKMTEPK